MPVTISFELVLVLIAACVGLELLAERLRFPPTTAFVAGGAALALLPGIPPLALDPDLTLILFLPPLLMGSAYETAWRDFRADLRIIAQLAVGAVVFTTLVVGVAAHWTVPDLPWAACFALGAIVSPPDAVSAKAVLATARLPHRIVVLLEGESLVNDASGLVLYRFAVASALTGAFSMAGAALQFVVVAAGGVAVGVVAAVLGMWVVRRLKDPRLSTLASLLTGWTAYIAADQLGVSGVLSAVTTGLIVGWRQHEAVSATARRQATAVWDVVIFVLEALVFILIGLSLHAVLGRLAAAPGGVAGSLLGMLPAVAAVVAATVLARFVWTLPAAYLPRVLFPRLRARDPSPPLSVLLVIGWAGMRGVVSLAIALALPDNFPGRDLILVATFAVILVTVLVQGTTLAPLIRLLRLERFSLGRGGDPLSVEAARVRIAQAQLEAVQQASSSPDGERHPRLLEQYAYRARAAERLASAVDTYAPHRTEHFGVVLDAVAAGRREALAMHRAGQIHDSVLNALEHELDLEEMNARLLSYPESVIS